MLCAISGFFMMLSLKKKLFYYSTSVKANEVVRFWSAINIIYDRYVVDSKRKL